MGTNRNRDELANIKTQPAGKQGYQQVNSSKSKVRKSARKSSRR